MIFAKANLRANRMPSPWLSLYLYRWTVAVPMHWRHLRGFTGQVGVSGRVGRRAWCLLWKPTPK